VSFITGSSAILAESIHSVADTMNQVFLLIGHKRSKKKPNEWHSFGFQKESFFWSLMVAILLFFIGSLFSIYEGVHKILHPEPLKDVYWIFLVLITSITIEGKTFMVAYKELRKKSKDKIIIIVEHINRVQTMVISNEKYLVLISIDVDDDSTGYQIEDTIDDIKTEIKKQIPQVETIYIEIQDPNRCFND